MENCLFWISTGHCDRWDTEKMDCHMPAPNISSQKWHWPLLRISAPNKSCTIRQKGRKDNDFWRKAGDIWKNSTFYCWPFLYIFFEPQLWSIWFFHLLSSHQFSPESSYRIGSKATTACSITLLDVLVTWWFAQEILGHEDMGWPSISHHDVEMEVLMVVVVLLAVMAVVNQREEYRAVKT